MPHFRPRLGVSSDRICILNDRNRVECWGSVEENQIEFKTAQRLDAEPEREFEFISVATSHVCAGMASQGVWCAGNNQDGALGIAAPDECQLGPYRDGTTTTHECSRSLRMVSRIDSVDTMATKQGSTCAVVRGRVTCWGLRSQEDGCKNASESWVVPGVRDVRKLAMGVSASCALSSDGQVWCWGENDLGQLGSIRRSERASVDEEKPSVCGGTLRFKPRIVQLPSRARDLSAGAAHVCALVGDDVYCWGNNGDSALGSGCEARSCALPVKVSWPSEESIVSLSLGGTTSCALTERGLI